MATIRHQISIGQMARVRKSVFEQEADRLHKKCLVILRAYPNGGMHGSAIPNSLSSRASSSGCITNSQMSWPGWLPSRGDSIGVLINTPIKNKKLFIKGLVPYTLHTGIKLHQNPYELYLLR